jgi:hypothetical protein
MILTVSSESWQNVWRVARQQSFSLQLLLVKSHASGAQKKNAANDESDYDENFTHTHTHGAQLRRSKKGNTTPSIITIKIIIIILTSVLFIFYVCTPLSLTIHTTTNIRERE